MKQLSPTQKGLFTAVAMMAALSFSLFVLKNPFESKFQYIVYCLLCFGVVWSLVSYHRSGTDKKTFGNYFSTGFKTFVVVALLMAAFSFIYFTTHTEFRDNSIAENSKLLAAQGNHLPKEIEENAAQLRKMFIPMTISITIFSYLIMGALITAIAAAFLSKKKDG